QHVRLRDPALGRETILRPPGPINVKQLCFSPDSKAVAVTYTTRSPDAAFVELRDVATGRELVPALGAHSQPIFGLPFSPDGQTLASGGRDGRAKVWEVPTGKLRFTSENPGERIDAVAFSPDGQTLAVGMSGADDKKPSGRVTLWDATSGTRLTNVLESDS